MKRYFSICFALLMMGAAACSSGNQEHTHGEDAEHTHAPGEEHGHDHGHDHEKPAGQETFVSDSTAAPADSTHQHEDGSHHHHH